MIFNFKGSARLKQEIESWLAEGIIDQSQADLLSERYELDQAPPWYLQSGFIIRSVAILLAGLAFLLVISENWHQFNIPVRMSIGLLPLLISYFLGYRFYSTGKISNAELTFFFANLLFGLNIFLQAQIFHISAYYPNGILWWIIGALPIAFFFRSILHNLLLTVLFYIWIVQLIDHHQFSYWAIVLLPALFYQLYRSPSKLMLLGVFFNAYMFFYTLNTWLNLKEYLTLTLSITLLAICGLHFFQEQYSQKFIERCHKVCFWIIALVFFLHTFKRNLITGSPGYSELVILLLVVAAGWLVYQKADKLDLSLLAVVVAIVLIQAAYAFYFSELGRDSMEIFILYNLLFFAFAVWLISYGIQHHLKYYFVSGVSLVVLQAISRYLDLFDNYLLTALIFILSSIFLYFINQYWDKRYAT